MDEPYTEEELRWFMDEYGYLPSHAGSDLDYFGGTESQFVDATDLENVPDEVESVNVDLVLDGERNYLS